ncbi:LOW QUALITY PROTEIN: uncharacterized protein [Panulirus ornatus]|uniref:LOW QUALITY PROTEIN: uncharacterized protein n=1 Tax=Panulirus ornatus TaxID=150431 RepID=UPI003A85351C
MEGLESSRTSTTTPESPPTTKTPKTSTTSESPPPSRTSKTPRTSESPPSSRTSKTPKTSESPPPSRTSKTPKTSESPPPSRTSKTPKTSESPPPSRTSKTPKTSESPPPSRTSKTPKTSESPPPSRTSKTPRTSKSPPPSRTSKTPKTSESPPPSRTSKTPKTSESPPPSRTSKTPKTSESPPPSRTSKTPKTSESPPPSRTSKAPTATAPRSSEPQRTSGGCQFKTSLCVLLKKQDEELLKNIEFKEKRELENEKDSGDDASQEETENGGRDGATDMKKKTKLRHKSVNDAAEDDNDNKKDMADDKKRKKSPIDQSNESKKEVKKKEKRDKADATKDKKRISKDGGKSSSQRTRDDNESKGKKNNRKDVENEEKAKQKKKIRDKEVKDEDKAKEKIKAKENCKNKDLEENEDSTKMKDMEEKKEKLVENKEIEDKGKTEEKEKREKTEETKTDEIARRIKGNIPEDEGKTEDGGTGDGVETRATEATEEEGQKSGKHQGFLMLKKKGPFSSWKRYFFMLDGHLLTYYRSQQEYGQLSVLKGSLDLAMLEEVRVKKPGLMKTHFPFRLTRRNLPSLKLAADTREDRERWLGLLQDILLRSNRISAHNSDKTLHTGRPFATIDASDQPAKFATLPNRTINPGESAPTTSSDEGEDDDTEFKLIQAKRIPRIPIIGPLSGFNIAEVNLRKVEPTKKLDEKKQVADDTDSSSSSDQSEDEQERPRRKPHVAAGVPAGVIKLRKVEKPAKTRKEDVTGDAEKGGDQTQREDPISAGEVFGVKLKKIQGKEGIVKEADVERKNEDVGANERRAIKQANIPLNSSNILSRSDVKLPKTSPLNQKKGTTERKKSPSPNIPLSKSIHSLTKAAEVVDPSAKVLRNVSTDNADSEDEDDEVKKDIITIRHAESSEIQCNDEVVHIEPSIVTQTAIERGDCAAHEPQEQQTIREDGGQLWPQKDDKEGISTDASLQGSPARGRSPPVVVRPVAITVTEDTDKEPEYEEVDDEFLHSIREAADLAFTSLDSQSRNEEQNEYDDFEEEFLKQVNNITPDSLVTSPQLSLPSSTSKSSLTHSILDEGLACDGAEHPAITFSSSDHHEGAPVHPESEDEHEYEEFDEDFIKKIQSPLKPPPLPAVITSSGESSRTPVGKDVPVRKGVTPPSSPIRARTNTNESVSSGKSDYENVDKRSSVFKLFKTKRSGSITSNDRKEMGEIKEAKDPKQKSSSTFSKILHGKKGKDKKKKDTKDDNTKPTEKLQESEEKSSEDSKCHADTKPTPDTTETPQDPPLYDEPDVTHQEPNTQEAVTVVMRHNIQPGSEESRCSTYSRASNSSRDQEPAPSIPEKTRVRAKSPNHDTPQSNRPVTNLYHLISPQEQGVENRTLVDGYITEKQIQAILSASEIRGKKRLSQPRSMGNVLNVPNASKASEGNVGEDWNHKRLSINSTESDEPLHATNFLSGDRLSSSSGSFRTLSKSYDSDVSSESHPVSQDLEGPTTPEQDFSTVSLRATSRLAESLTVGNRVSLTSPEFTVVEEDVPSTPDATKTTFPVEAEREEQTTTSASTGAPIFTLENEEDEQEDYFPVVGGDVELRLPRDVSLQKPSAEDVRTSGITGLKEYLNTIDGKDEELTEVKSSISRLGHSAAVEKLKETSNEL